MAKAHMNFIKAIQATHDAMGYAQPVHTDKWQGIDISDKPEMRMYELINWDLRAPMSTMDLEFYRQQIQPNLPWCDDHFEERVCGEPINPGEQWKNWPWGHSAANFLMEDGKFEVNYMERYWAGKEFDDWPHGTLLEGIRGRKYGDLDDIVDLLSKDPLSRQAYLPIFFPEDTGGRGRVPCTLGYHWLMRGGMLHVYYPIRSCDFYRHFRDDIYLTIRLTIWLLERLRRENPDVWNGVSLGMYSMWIGSLHVFENDYRQLFGEK